MNHRWISWHLMPSRKAWALLLSLGFMWCCNSATEFTAIEKKDLTSQGSSDASPEKIVRTFAAAETKKATVRWVPEDNTIVETVDMQKASPLALTFDQMERPLHELSASQGYDGRNNSEGFSLWQSGLLDLLLVMDNSGTMQPYQEQVAAKLEPLLENIKNTNWRIAVVTTDSPCVRGVVSRSDYDVDKMAAENAFKAAVRAGTSGSNTERGIEMAIKGFSPESYCSTNRNKWTRDGAKTAVIVVSDEANCGSAVNESCTGSFSYFGPSDFKSQTPANTRFFGLLYDQNTCEYNGYDKQPDDYYALAKSVADGGTGGLWRPICLADYTEVLGEISRNVGEILTREFTLSAPPTQGSLKVYFDGIEAQSGFSVQGKKVTLVGNESLAQRVEFRYEHGASPRFSAMQLGGSMDPKSLVVKMNGQEVSAEEFDVDQTSNELRFKRMPPDYAKVEVSYREPGELPAKFDGPTGIVVASLRVMVNEKPASNFQFDAQTGEVQFAEAPLDGASIKIEARQISDYVVDYKLTNANMDGLANIKIRDPRSKMEIEGSADQGILSLAIETVENLDQVEVVYELQPDPANFVISLPENPIAESIRLQGSDVAKSCIASARREGRTIHAECLLEVPEAVELEFDYVVRRVSEFLVEAPSGMRISKWQVFVDGQSVPFTKEGSSFSVDPGLLTDQSKVVIEGIPRSTVVATN
jgi:hypothetical protein